jgi:hypothetical protein
MLRAIEKDVLGYVARRYGASGLREQIDHVALASREFTGCGVYTNLTLHARESLPAIHPLEIPFHGPFIESPALELGASSLVWCDKAGYLECIEIVTPGDNYPETEFEYTLERDPNT